LCYTKTFQEPKKIKNLKNFEEIRRIAIETINIETQSVANLVNYVDSHFAEAVQLIFNSNGRVIVTGIGKSAIIAQKIVATFNSTGTPAIFMHAADAIHGDLGTIQKEDVVICLSKSGNTPEIKVLVPLIKNFGNKIIAMVSNTDSFLAKEADFVIRATVETEACPNNLVPTSSTTAQLVMGDAMAICLLNLRSFSSADFARYHPGGVLGKKLYTTVKDLATYNDVPFVFLKDKLKQVILEISSKRLGASAVLNDKNELCGIITDGDLRRMLEKNMPLENLTAHDIMNRSPKTVDKDTLAIKAYEMMKKNKITQLLVVEDNKYVGIVHIHDILREGIV